MRDALHEVLAGHALSADVAQRCFSEGLSGRGDPSLLAGLLVALAQRGESVDEVVGAARALRAHMRPFEHDHPNAVDTCGTGGDGLRTFNISTAAALVAAAAGARVVKHGNRAVSSSCGSADLLEAAGLRLDLPPEGARACLDEAGICFLFAPAYHPAMAHAAPVRRALGIRTLFNLVGPLANPSGLRRQVLGVSQADHVALLADALSQLGADFALVVHGAGGADELTLEGPNRVAQVGHLADAGDLSRAPVELGLRPALVSDLKGGGASRNLEILSGLLRGEPGPIREAVLLNAAAALLVAGTADTVLDGIDAASAALDRGIARETLKRWIAVSERFG